MNVKQNIYFLLKKAHTHKKKAKQAKEEKRRGKETKEEKNVVVNSICRTVSVTWCDIIFEFALCTFNFSPGCSHEFKVVFV